MELLNTKENSKDLLEAKLGEYSKRISGKLEKVEENTDRYQMYAKRLGLNWNTEISNRELEHMQDEIYIEMAKMLDSVENPVMYKDVNAYINYVVSLIEKSADEYNDENFERDIRKELNKKVEEVLKQAQIDDIDKEIINLGNTKNGLLGKILGKSREVELKREQLTLIKSLLQSDSERDQEDCSVNEIMAKMLYYKKQHNGNLPIELCVLASQITSVFEVDEGEVTKIVNKKYGSQLPVVQNGNNSIFRRRSNRILEEQNQRLEKELHMMNDRDSNQYRMQSKFNKSATDNLREIYYHMKNIQDAIRKRVDPEKNPAKAQPII